MDGPAPPKDTGLKNIIDKLAEFVARNGPEFENITRTKQQGNPRFSFLYGGEYYQYYQWRVSHEQAALKQQPPNMQLPIPNWNNLMPPHQNHPPRPLHGGHPSMMNIANITRDIENIVTQQTTLREQIRQSEQNLSAQHGVLMQQQQKQIDEAIEKAQSDSIMKQAEENNINLIEFETILTPIIESCTKDSISAGKNWILQHATDAPKGNTILQYLLKKALVNGVTFTQKLHLIYLVNDVLHHCVRKNAEDLKNNLENIVIPMFCSAEIIASEEQKTKLMKLLSLWESKLNFFDACVISKLRSSNSSMQEYKTNLLNFHNFVVTNIQQQTQVAFENYKQQHTAFVQHASQQIQLLDTQKIQLEQQNQQNFINQIPPLMSQSCDVNNLNGNSLHGKDNHMNSVPPQQIMQGMNMSYSMQPIRPNESSFENFQNPEPPVQGPNMTGKGVYQVPPPKFLIPDFSKPPPGFSNPSQMPGQPVAVDNTIIASISAEVHPPQPAEEIKPTASYYELPAGLMVPLIRLEDYNYRSLDPEEIRLPPPTAPSERLIQAIEAFYSHPSHDRPRDGEGWEKLGLYEYYKVKNSAKKMKEEEFQKGIRESSRSPSPIVIEVVKPKRINKRMYRSKSRSRSKSKSRSRSKSHSRSRSRSRSRSPNVRQQPRRNNNRHYSHSSPKRGGKSPLNRRSQSPPILNTRKERDRDRNRGERERRDLSRSPPPSFINFASKTAGDCIEETNKGHQLLMKMGWGGSGTGLGAQAQGIDEPISAGEVRDRQDMYKGIGVSLNDPYENFRKNKGAAFINRMRSRDNERKKSKHQANQNSDEPPDY